MLTDRRALLAGLGGLALSGCATTLPPALAGRATLAPLRLDVGRLTHITVCLRPFRAAGPRLDVETIGNKRVVHNYGHGGSGWSLSWGSAALAARNAMADGQRDIAVIGCGALGLTAATVLQRAGARVTIYARDRLPQTRSARASGIWSPDSRIAAADKVSPAFPTLWEAMARHSFAMHQTHVGVPDAPVAWADRYSIGDGVAVARAHDPDAVQFARYDDRLADIVPHDRLLAPAESPFPALHVHRGVGMQFNIAALGDRLMRDFVAEGGRIETMVFDAPADFARLAQPVIVNCTGYGARALMRDESIVPVRGQIGWLPPQPEIDYGLYYRRVSIVARTDGIVVQGVGPSDMYGYGNDSEAPDRAEAEAAVRAVAGLFAA
jgi:glycine/D-amino acid oxidase-like deaminating enzyme